MRNLSSSNKRQRSLDAIKKFRELQLKTPGFGSGSSFPDAVKQVADPDIEDAVRHGLAHGTNTMGFREMTKD